MFAGLMGGFNTVTAPRLILECFPTKMRGIGGIFANSVAGGVFISFSLGYLLEKHLADWWYVFLLAPCALSILRMIFILTIFRFETPVYYISCIEKMKDNAASKKQISVYREKSDFIFKKFNKNLNDIDYEIKLIKENVILSYKKGESGFCDLIYTNIIHRDRRYSFLAVQGFMAFASLSGQTFCDSYSKNVFDILSGSEDFGFKITFYSGFAAIIGSILGAIIVKRAPR